MHIVAVLAVPKKIRSNVFDQHWLKTTAEQARIERSLADLILGHWGVDIIKLFSSSLPRLECLSLESVSVQV